MIIFELQVKFIQFVKEPFQRISSPSVSLTTSFFSLPNIYLFTLFLISSNYYLCSTKPFSFFLFLSEPTTFSTYSTDSHLPLSFFKTTFINDIREVGLSSPEEPMELDLATARNSPISDSTSASSAGTGKS